MEGVHKGPCCPYVDTVALAKANRQGALNCCLPVWSNAGKLGGNQEGFGVGACMRTGTQVVFVALISDLTDAWMQVDYSGGIRTKRKICLTLVCSFDVCLWV